MFRFSLFDLKRNRIALFRSVVCLQQIHRMCTKQQQFNYNKGKRTHFWIFLIYSLVRVKTQKVNFHKYRTRCLVESTENANETTETQKKIKKNSNEMPHKLVFSFTWYRFIAACSCYCWYIFCDSTLFGWIEEALIVWFTLIKLRTMRSNERIVTQQKEEAPKHWVCVYSAQPETRTGECVYGARRKRVTTSLYESQFGIKHKSKSNLLGKWFFAWVFQPRFCNRRTARTLYFRSFPFYLLGWHVVQ